jgi:seryl-tRNA synthetase
MLDLTDLCERPDHYRRYLADRLADPAAIDAILNLAATRKRLVSEIDERKRQRNDLTRQVAAVAESEPRNQLREQARQRGITIKEQEERLRQCEDELDALALTLPNLPHPTVPLGSAAANQEIRRHGEPGLPIPTTRAHWEVGPALGLDVERGARLAGSRFYLLTGLVARLEMALVQFMIDMHVDRHGYQLVIPPYMVNRKTMQGCGQLPKFQNELYQTQDELYLVPTAESALAGLYADEILDGDLPIKLVGFTPCFRREAGAAGRDARGILRVHQFHKVELFKFTAPEQSYDELESLVADAEAVLQALELPYRVVLLSAGDMGFAAAKTYDLEVWLPGQNCYREISSCSNVEAFQARRTNTRYRSGPKEKPRLVHMLNGSGLAVGRTMIAILENYQQADGSVIVPDALRLYLGGLEALRPANDFAAV